MADLALFMSLSQSWLHTGRANQSRDESNSHHVSTKKAWICTGQFHQDALWPFYMQFYGELMML